MPRIQILDRDTVHSNKLGRDVTARKFLACSPEWSWVLDYKGGKMSSDEYTKLYLSKLDRNAEKVLNWVTSLPEKRVTFTCFCPSGAFCHTTPAYRMVSRELSK